SDSRILAAFASDRSISKFVPSSAKVIVVSAEEPSMSSISLVMVWRAILPSTWVDTPVKNPPTGQVGARLLQRPIGRHKAFGYPPELIARAESGRSYQWPPIAIVVADPALTPA